MTIARRTLLAGGFSLAAAPMAVTRAVRAQASYPDKPVRLVVPFPPGGVTDVVARLLAQKMAADLGQPITIFVEVEMESERADLIDTAKREFTNAPEVQQCYYVTGEADFILIVVVPTMAAYEALTRRLFFGNNNVKRFRTFVAMDRVKVGLAVPLPPDHTRA